jgi:hypothetical protein
MDFLGVQRMSQQLSTPDAASQAAQLILQLGTGYIASSALQVAARLTIADRLAAGPRTAAELAAETGVQADALYRVLRTLSSMGVFVEMPSRRFALNPAAELLRTNHPARHHPLILWMTDPFHFRTYAETMHSVETGRPAADKVAGMPVFEYFAKDRELSDTFNNAMTAFSAQVAPAALRAYDFSGIEVLVDVAGGHGELLMSIASAYPHLRGILFDVDHVAAGAAARIQAAGLADRVQTAAGDFFKSVPAADSYILKHIIHDWDDERATLILENIRRAMTRTAASRVVLLESVLQPANQPDFGKLIDVEMMLMPGGRERTAEEFGALFERAGFTLSRIVPTESPLSVVEARPAR